MTAERRALPKAGKLALSRPRSSEVLAAGRTGAVVHNDRIDARHILAAGSALSGLATVMFGLIADDLWSATLIWAIAGIGFAGAYMPGHEGFEVRRETGKE